MDSEGNKDECEEVFLDEQDIDEEELPEVDDESNSDVESDSDSDFEGICAVVCSPTDSTLVAAGGSGTGAFLWNINQGDQRQVIIGNDDSVSSVAFSADGKFLACGTGQGRVQVWDICSSSHKCTFDGPEDIEWVRWHPRGHFVLAGSMDDFTVWLWDIDEDAYLYTLFGHECGVTCGDFTPDGSTICTGSDDASLRIWNPEDGNNIHVVQGHSYHTKGLTCLMITPDSALAITGSSDCSVRIVNIRTGEVVNSLISHEDLIQCVGLSPRLPLVATGGGKELIIWEITHSLFRVVFENVCNSFRSLRISFHEDLIQCVGLSPRLPLVATGGGKELIIWEITHSLFRVVFEAHVSCLVWLGASQYIATGCADGKILIIDSLSGCLVKTFNDHSKTILSLSISSNGKFLVSGSEDKQVLVFDIAEFS